MNQLKWLIGKWQSITAEIIIEPTNIIYQEQIEISFSGQPLLNFRTRSWNPNNKKPMHFENGFIRPKPQSNIVSLVSAHNFGVTLIEEGEIEDKKLVLKSKKLDRISFAKPPEVTELNRTFILNSNDELEITTDMGTLNYPLKKHLRARYKKIQ